MIPVARVLHDGYTMISNRLSDVHICRIDMLMGAQLDTPCTEQRGENAGAKQYRSV